MYTLELYNTLWSGSVYPFNQIFDIGFFGLHEGREWKEGTGRGEKGHKVTEKEVFPVVLM